MKSSNGQVLRHRRAELLNTIITQIVTSRWILIVEINSITFKNTICDTITKNNHNNNVVNAVVWFPISNIVLILIPISVIFCTLIISFCNNTNKSYAIIDNKNHIAKWWFTSTLIKN